MPNENEELIKCAINNNIEAVKKLLSQGCNPNYENKEGETALIATAEKGNLEVLKVLLQDNHININYSNKDDETALIWAARYGHLEIVKELLIHKANINAKNSYFETALISAIRYISWSEGENSDAMNKRMELINLLLINGSDVNDGDYKGQTALMIADKYGRLEIKKTLENFMQDNTKPMNGDINNISANKNTEPDVKKIKKSVSQTSIFDSNNLFDQFDLLRAAENGDLEKVKVLLDTGFVDTNYVKQNSNNALIIAANYGYLKIVELLLAKGFNANHANKDHETPLLRVIDSYLPLRNNQTELSDRAAIIKALFANGANLNHSNNKGDTGLILAAKNNNLFFVNMLLEKEVNIDASNNESDTALIISARRGYFDILKTLLAKGANIDHLDKHGNTSLIIAAEYSNLAQEKHSLSNRDWYVNIITELLANGADVNHTNNYGDTALIKSCDSISLQITKTLLNHNKINVNIANKNGDTALIIAAKYVQLEKIRDLLAKGANVTVTNNNHQTALLSVVERFNSSPSDYPHVIDNRTEIVKELLAKGASIKEVDKNVDTALTIAAKNGYLNIVKEFLSRGHYLNQLFNYLEIPLLSVIRPCNSSHDNNPNSLINRIEIIKELLAKGAYINFRNNKGETPLILAAKIKNLAFVNLLLEKGADTNFIDATGKTALMWAVTHGQVEMVKTLLTNGAKVNIADSIGDTALIWVADYYQFLLHEYYPDLIKRYAEIAKQLLDNGADVNHANTYGDTVLIKSSRFNNLEVIDVLLNNEKINIEFINKFGETALICAVKYGQVEIVKKLIAKGADINYVDEYLNSALIFATLPPNQLGDYPRMGMNVYIEIAKVLLANGANINNENKYGYTPLMYAIKYNAWEMINQLLSYGANVMHKNHKADSAIMFDDKFNSEKASETLNKFINFKNFIQEKAELSIHEINSIIDDTKTAENYRYENNIRNIKKSETQNKKEIKLITLLKSYLIDLENKFQVNGIANDDIKNFLKKEFINNLKVENTYSLLHLAIFNKMTTLANWLIEFGIDTQQKDSANLTVWHYACLLLVPEIAFAIKPDPKLNQDDQRFLNDIIDLKLATDNKHANDENDDYPRDLILNYYGCSCKRELESNKNEEQANSNFDKQDTSKEWLMSM